MVAAVHKWPGETLVAVHRTYLSSDGSGKARVEPTKKMLGPTRGGAVRLSPAAETLVVAEGIETALSVSEATGLPCWAALSTSGIKNLILPALVRKIVVAADRDTDGQVAADAARDRWRVEGRSVFIATPEHVNDFNDLLMEASR